MAESDLNSYGFKQSVLQPLTAFDFEKSQTRYLSTGCSNIDELLRGGLPLRGITEIAGESGCGKTQLCLQMSLTVQYPEHLGGLNGGAVYICTEDTFPTKRLQQLIQHFPGRYYKSNNADHLKNSEKYVTKEPTDNSTGDHVLRGRFYPKNEDERGDGSNRALNRTCLNPLKESFGTTTDNLRPNRETKLSNVQINFGNNIFIEHIANYDGLSECLTKRLPVLMKKKPIKLILIDSIAGVFRGTYDITEGRNRTRHMRAVGLLLHQLSFKEVVVVCVNQVTSSGSSTNVPALGLSWANMVTTRLQLFNNIHKTIKVLFAPDLANNSTEYTIEESGVCNI